MVRAPSLPLRARSSWLTPELFWELVKQFGLPVAMLLVAIVAIARGTFVRGGELADKQAEVDSYKALYERERTDRMAAEQGLVKTSAASVDVATAVKDALAEMVKRDPYTERLEGRRSGR